MKIYIIGPPGSGKTTLSKILENKYHTKAYELDCIVHDDFDHHQKRSSQDITNRFNQIIKQNNWIIEDVGRDIFNEGLKEADKIYYLKIPKKVIMIRVIRRWIKQRLGKEPYNYHPTFYQLYDMIKVVNKYYKKEKEKIKKIEEYPDKVIYLTNKEIKSLE